MNSYFKGDKVKVYDTNKIYIRLPKTFPHQIKNKIYTNYSDILSVYLKHYMLKYFYYITTLEYLNPFICVYIFLTKV